MAEIEAFRDEINKRGDHGHVISWSNLGQGDYGESIEMIGSAMRTSQVFGTFTTGICQIQGSNDGSNWFRLTDSHGNELRFNSHGIAKVTELTRYTRPFVEAGDGSTDISVYMLIRKESR